MLKFLVLAVVASMVSAGSDPTDDYLQEGFDVYNLLASCYGKEKMNNFILELAEATEKCGLDKSDVAVAKKVIKEAGAGGKPVLGRRRRQADVTQNEIDDFLATYKKYEGQNEEAMKGLQCVLQSFGVINEDVSVNIEGVLAAFADLKDPAHVEKLNVGMNDCKKVSESWPQEMLERYYGAEKVNVARTHIFFSCAKKIEHRLCYTKQAYELMVLMYGKMDDVDHEEYGLPADDWEASYDALRAETETASPVHYLIDMFFWNKARFL